MVMPFGMVSQCQFSDVAGSCSQAHGPHANSLLAYPYFFCYGTALANVLALHG